MNRNETSLSCQPLTAADCDLREFPFMPLDVVRLRDSDIAAISSGDEFRCAVLLWCASWHQVPAASLPDDDIILAQLAGYGRVVKEWKKVREGSLRGWIKCSDGRLYHPVVAEKAAEAWNRKQERSWNTECARIKKLNQRHGLSGDSAIQYPTFEQFLSPDYTPPKAPDVPKMSPGTKQGCPEGHGSDVPDMSLGKQHRQGEGEGQGQGQYLNPTSVEAGSSAPNPGAEKTDDPPTPTRKGIVCGLLRSAGMADAAPHYLTDEAWEQILAKRTNEEIVEVARAKMAARPGQRTGLKYIAPALMDDPVQPPAASNARASPSPRRQTLTETRAETLAALTGRSRNHERPNADERDITGESTRIE